MQLRQSFLKLLTANLFDWAGMLLSEYRGLSAAEIRGSRSLFTSAIIPTHMWRWSVMPLASHLIAANEIVDRQNFSLRNLVTTITT
mgnify:CR=1 FL=1